MKEDTPANASAMLSPRPPLFELADATVVRAGTPILSVPSFRLDEGEQVALLGPNGSGKSTFVKLITREVLPLFRENPPVRFKGNPRASLTEVKRCLGIVSSSMQDQITVHLPAIDVVAGGLFGTLGVLPAATQADEARAYAFKKMTLLGVEDLAERDIMTLSTGQARRVLIARALVHDPETLVFDEPCTGLDPEGMHYVRASMRMLAQAGKGIVLVTHYPEDVIPEIKRIVLLKQGEVFADGLKRELLTSENMSALFDVPLRVNCLRAAVSGELTAQSNSRTNQAITPHRLDSHNNPRRLDPRSRDAREEEYFSLVSVY